MTQTFESSTALSHTVFNTLTQCDVATWRITKFLQVPNWWYGFLLSVSSNRCGWRYEKNSGIQINFIKSFASAEKEVQRNSNICKHTKHYRLFTSLAVVLAVDLLCCILVYLMTTSDMRNIVHISCISENMWKIMYVFQNQVCQYCSCRISIMVWLHNHSYRIDLLSM